MSTWLVYRENPFCTSRHTYAATAVGALTTRDT